MAKNDLSRLNAYLSAQVRFYRTQMKMTLRELDDALAMPRGTISRIERGDKRLDCLTLQRLAAYLELSVDHFFEGAPEIELTSFRTPTSGVTVADVAILLEAYGEIRDPAIRREFLSLIRSVGDSALYEQLQDDRPKSA